AGEDLVVAERRRDGLLDADPEVPEIRGAEPASLALVESHDVLRDLALVERLAHRREPVAPTAASALLRCDEAADRSPEILLPEALAETRRAAFGQEDRRRARPARELGGILGDRLAEQMVGGKAVLGEAQRALDDLGKALRAELLEGRDPGVDR